MTIEGPVPIGFAILLGVCFVLWVAAWILAPRLAGNRRVLQRLIVRVAKWGVGLAAAGLILLMFRWLLVPFFSKRIWLLIWGLSVVGAAGYLAYYWRKVYPLRVIAWEEAERKRRYLPRAGQSGNRPRRRSRRRR